VRFDPTTSFLDDGAVLMGGAPLRLWRLSPRAQHLLERWQVGAPVGDGRATGLLARRLTTAGALLCDPKSATFTVDAVTVVIPVRDRPQQLERLLSTLQCSCIVVDDASRQSDRTHQIADKYGARFVGLGDHSGPAAARNAGLAQATTPLVAFVDSDCLPQTGWLDALLGYFDDPMVAVVAPRVVPAPVTRQTLVSRYDVVRSSLDRGVRGGLVRPLSPIPYIPSAAMVVRRGVAGSALFDPRLRVGEDVDLVWRLSAAGWDVWYEPSSLVEHEGPNSGPGFLARRALYGSSAAPLAARHPRAMAPLHVSAWSASVWTLALARRPFSAVLILSTSLAILARRLRGLVNDPVPLAAKIVGGGTVRSALPALAGLTRAWSPALALALLFRRTRRPAAAAFMLPALQDWRNAPGDLDPLRYVVLHGADDLAYGIGVWTGCARERLVVPLVPHLSFRSRVWSNGSLRRQLGHPQDQIPESAGSSSRRRNRVSRSIGA
jgi:mycofactocin system glycosyltransferase